jgi:hypothetical protein
MRGLSGYILLFMYGKLKLSLCLTKYYAMMAYREADV